MYFVSPITILESPRFHYYSNTFPTATAVVAMSKTKSSPCMPGAAKDNALVPSVSYNSGKNCPVTVKPFPSTDLFSSGGHH